MQLAVACAAGFVGGAFGALVTVMVLIAISARGEYVRHVADHQGVSGHHHPDF